MAAVSDRKLVDPTVIVDNLVLGVVPNSVQFTEGMGEQKVFVATAGGGSVQQIVADDVTGKQSHLKVHVFPTFENIKNIRAIKANMNGHVVTLSDAASDFHRTITAAVLVNNYEVKLGTDDVIELEFIGNPSV